MIKATAISAGDIQSQVSGAQLDNLKNRSKMLSEQALKSKEEIDKAAGGFEALMLHQMLTAMWSTVQPAGLFGEQSNQEQIYRDMFHQALADSVAKGKGMGIKEMLAKEIARADGASNDKDLEKDE